MLDELTKKLETTSFYNFYHKYFNSEEPEIYEILCRFAEKTDEFFFIQVGANDGYTNDPVHWFIQLYNWQGILLEPQEKVYEEELKCTYGDLENLELINAAIDSECGEKDMYKVGFSDSKWATGLSSFKKDMIEKQYTRGYIEDKAQENGEDLPVDKADYIATETVRTITFEQLLEERNIDGINGLFIDAEGYDHKVLELYDFDAYLPQLILFEHLHMTEEQVQHWIKRFRKMGHSICRSKHNVLAYNEEAT